MTTSAQPKMVRICCPDTRKTLCKMREEDEWPADLVLWLWCKGHHFAHRVDAEYVKEVRALDASKIYR